MNTVRGLIAFSDLIGYAKFNAEKPDEEVFRLLSDYYEFVGDGLKPAAGEVIKFMGDGVLMFFPEMAVDSAVRALLEMQTEGDKFLEKRGVACKHRIRVHFGSFCYGRIGTREDKRADVLGSAVNAMFLLKSNGVAITNEAYRKLEPGTRALFKKQNPTVVFVPATEPEEVPHKE